MEAAVRLASHAQLFIAPLPPRLGLGAEDAMALR